MKKFLMMVLAVALAATPALAGDVTMSGSYFLQGYSADFDGPSDAWYINDLDIKLTLKSGDVTAVVDIEPVDEGWDQLAGHTHANNTLADNYYITAPLMAGLTLKTGEYALDFGKKIAIYNEGGFNIGLTYVVNDKVTVVGTIGKELEDDFDNAGTADMEDADTDVVVLSALMKDLGPLTKLNFHIAYQMVEEKDNYVTEADSSDSLICIEAALPAGPVALAAELGFASGDVAEGNYFDIVAGLKGLVGFDLNVELFMASDKLAFDNDENWSPLLILGNDDFEAFDGSWTNITFFAVSGSYAVNDKITVAGAAAMLLPTDDAAVTPLIGIAADWDVTEIDVTGTYKFADNFSVMAGAGLVSGDAEATVLTTKATFSF